MSTDHDTDDTIEVSRDELEQLIDERVEARLAAGQTTRRDMVKAGGALGLGGLLGGAAVAEGTDRASAADTSQPDVGTASTPVDAYLNWAEFYDAGKDPADAGEVTRNGPDIRAHSGGAVRELSALPIAIVASGSVQLSSGSATVDTGISTAGATFDLGLGGDPSENADLAASLDLTGSTAQVEIVEDSTSVGNPRAYYDIFRIR